MIDRSQMDRARRALSRRNFLTSAALLTAGLVLPRRSLSEESKPRANAQASTSAALTAAKDSTLIYVSPLRSNGSESSCHAEVWFVADQRDLLVVTDAKRWRAASIEQGLDRARIWVGDFGVWKDASFRKAPSYEARASLDTARTAHATALAAFGKKYTAEWGKWGPRFEEGLASGDRVLIRYAPAG